MKPWTSEIASTIHWTLLHGNHQIMQVIVEVGETQRTPLNSSIEAVLPIMKIHISNPSHVQPHLDLTPRHANLKHSQVRLCPDSMAKSSSCLQLLQCKPCISLVICARPFQVKLGTKDVRAELHEMPPSEVLKPYAPWQHAINDWIHPIILSRTFHDGDPPLMYKDNPSPTSPIYVKFDGGSTARFVFNGFLTLDPGKKTYATNDNHPREVFNSTSSADPTLASVIVNADYQPFHTFNWKVLSFMYQLSNMELIYRHTKFGYFIPDT